MTASGGGREFQLIMANPEGGGILLPPCQQIGSRYFTKGRRWAIPLACPAVWAIIEIWPKTGIGIPTALYFGVTSRLKSPVVREFDTHQENAGVRPGVHLPAGSPSR